MRVISLGRPRGLSRTGSRHLLAPRALCEHSCTLVQVCNYAFCRGVGPRVAVSFAVLPRQRAPRRRASSQPVCDGRLGRRSLRCERAVSSGAEFSATGIAELNKCAILLYATARSLGSAFLLPCSRASPPPAEAPIGLPFVEGDYTHPSSAVSLTNGRDPATLAQHVVRSANAMKIRPHGCHGWLVQPCLPSCS